MTDIMPLAVNALYHRYELDLFSVETSRDLESLDTILGQ